LPLFSELNETQKLTVLCAQLAEDKLAENVSILDLSKIESSPADYFIIASCESENQILAITDLILANCVNYRLVKPKVEGLESPEWVLLDFFDLVVHILLKDNRNFYKIEKIWGDADFYKVNDDGDLLLSTFEEAMSIYE
jgi:ribosome-associated protein